MEYEFCFKISELEKDLKIYKDYFKELPKYYIKRDCLKSYSVSELEKMAKDSLKLCNYYNNLLLENKGFTEKEKRFLLRCQRFAKLCYFCYNDEFLSRTKFLKVS